MSLTNFGFMCFHLNLGECKNNKVMRSNNIESIDITCQLENNRGGWGRDDCSNLSFLRLIHQSKTSFNPSDASLDLLHTMRVSIL